MRANQGWDEQIPIRIPPAAIYFPINFVGTPESKLHHHLVIWAEP
jgi:hypothetical protein